ncbi:major facilitator transporter [Anopheles sinensis]|uniref:Major facilitator transporter n=1 Tax=Anopheles sinensis TaxID=74873 RepID=A0A084WPC1_ANOSI|nr:major facilitator transporter [Anopheles sinensis]
MSSKPDGFTVGGKLNTRPKDSSLRRVFDVADGRNNYSTPVKGLGVDGRGGQVNRCAAARRSGETAKSRNGQQYYSTTARVFNCRRPPPTTHICKKPIRHE